MIHVLFPNCIKSLKTALQLCNKSLHCAFSANLFLIVWSGCNCETVQEIEPNMIKLMSIIITTLLLQAMNRFHSRSGMNFKYRRRLKSLDDITQTDSDNYFRPFNILNNLSLPLYFFFDEQIMCSETFDWISGMQGQS